MDTLVLTAIGDDRPGLVSALSARLTAHGASWERSQMSRLAGKFAGIVEVCVPADNVPALVTDLDNLAAEGLQVTVGHTPAGATPSTDADVAHRWTLDVVGADRPGIVDQISSLLSERGISIEDLGTAVSNAPMAGGTLFVAHASLTAPAGSDAADVRAVLEALADELMVEVALADEPDDIPA
jgi:glycine cleavage system regulatory protein